MVVSCIEFAEEWAVSVARSLTNETMLIMLKPWSSGTPPQRVLALGADGDINSNAVERALEEVTAVVVACTLADSSEEVAAQKILARFLNVERVFVLLAHLIPPSTQLNQEQNDAILARYERMVSLGFDDVLIDPSHETAELLRSISLARTLWNCNVRRMEHMLSSEPEHISQEEADGLETHHGDLLWESMLRALIPHFPPLNPELVESPTTVDRYRNLRRRSVDSENMLFGMDEQNITRAIKVIRKDTVMSPTELKDIYREFQLLSDVIRHPNVVRCIDLLHGPTRVYLVFEYAGDTNLAQLLSSQPGQRLDEQEALQCFDHVLAGLAHCHSKDIAHQNLTLEHVVITMVPGPSYFCRIVDFNRAMFSNGNTTSTMVCGRLPCMAPEMALGQAYLPQRADCWSLGIVLLETGGGLGSLARSLPYNPEAADQSEVALRIQQFFRTGGSHGRALATVGAVSNAEITDRLQRLLQPDPNDRVVLQSLANGT